MNGKFSHRGLLVCWSILPVNKFGGLERVIDPSPHGRLIVALIPREVSRTEMCPVRNNGGLVSGRSFAARCGCGAAGGSGGAGCSRRTN